MNQKRHHTQMYRLCDASKQEQMFVVAQIVRNKYALDYWMTALGYVKETPVYRQEVKKKIKEAEAAVTFYEGDYRQYYKKTNTLDPWEAIQDAAGEFWRELSRMMTFHEQAIARLLLKNGVTNTDWLCKLATAKSLLNCVSYICGLECVHAPRIRPILGVGGAVCELSAMQSASETPGLPSVMGHMQRICERLNLLIISKLGIKDGMFDGEDKEINRAIEIAGSNIQTTLMNYALMWELINGQGITLEEAKAKVKANQERAAQLEKKAEEKAAKKAALKEAKKKAKQNE